MLCCFFSANLFVIAMPKPLPIKNSVLKIQDAVLLSNLEWEYVKVNSEDNRYPEIHD